MAAVPVVEVAVVLVEEAEAPGRRPPQRDHLRRPPHGRPHHRPLDHRLPQHVQISAAPPASVVQAAPALAPQTLAELDRAEQGDPTSLPEIGRKSALDHPPEPGPKIGQTSAPMNVRELVPVSTTGLRSTTGPPREIDLELITALASPIVLPRCQGSAIAPMLTTDSPTVERTLQTATTICRTGCRTRETGPTTAKTARTGTTITVKTGRTGPATITETGIMDTATAAIGITCGTNTPAGPPSA